MCLSSLEILYLLPIASMVTLKHPNTQDVFLATSLILFPAVLPRPASTILLKLSLMKEFYGFVGWGGNVKTAILHLRNCVGC